jgi:hypothetical protein
VLCECAAPDVGAGVREKACTEWVDKEVVPGLILAHPISPTVAPISLSY